MIASAVRYIIEETEHLRRVAFGFLNLSKLDELKVEPFRLNDLVDEAVSHLRAIYPRVRFSVPRAGAGIDVVADRQKIKQAIDNVLTNALEAVAGSGGRDRGGPGPGGRHGEVRIRDNGKGSAPRNWSASPGRNFPPRTWGPGWGWSSPGVSSNCTTAAWRSIRARARGRP